MRCRALAILLLCLAPASSHTRAGDKLADEVAGLAGPRIDEGRSVGIVVGVFHDGRSEVFGFGRPSIEADEPPDGRTIFAIGSITKVFTSIALIDMAREGLLKLDDPVASLAPAGTRMPEHDGHVITLRTLANHTSGLPRIIPKVMGRAAVGLDPYAGVTSDDVYRFLGTCKLGRDPGSKYAYSNLGAGLLGLSLARRAGTSYEELIASRIGRPLGLTDTRITLDPARQFRLARPYTKKGRPALAWTFDAFAGAGALHSTADDLLTFARANLGLVPAPDRLRGAMEEARVPRTQADGAGVSIGLGWHVFVEDKSHDRPEVTWHTGGTGGFTSFIGLSRVRRTAVVVLNNSDDDVGDLGLAVLDLLDPRAGRKP